MLAAEDKDRIFLYNGKLDLRGRVCAYYGIYKTYDGLRFTECAIGNYFTDKEPHPATKEQHDLLFQKMKEAGYEWDAEKKELKKIQDEEYNGEDYGIDSLYHAQRILEKTLGSVDGYQSDDGILEHKCAISAVKKLYEQKPAEWSKEDKRNLNDAILFIKTGTYSLDKDNLINWLKSLRPQTQWKPSEEQIKSLEEVIDEGHFTSYPNALETLYEQLKQL